MYIFFSRQSGRTFKELKSLRQECEIQRHLHHPNIIQMIDSFETENEVEIKTMCVYIKNMFLYRCFYDLI